MNAFWKFCVSESTIEIEIANQLARQLRRKLPATQPAYLHEITVPFDRQMVVAFGNSKHTFE